MVGVGRTPGFTPEQPARGAYHPGLHPSRSSPGCALHARGAGQFVSSGEGPGAALFRFRVVPCVGPLAASALLQHNGVCLFRLMVYLFRLVDARPGHSPQKPPTPKPANGAISLAE